MTSDTCGDSRGFVSFRQLSAPRQILTVSAMVVFSFLLALGGAEALCRLANRTWPVDKSFRQELPPNFKIAGPPYGYHLAPNAKGRAATWIGGQLAFDVFYSTDRRGHRVTPVPDADARDKFAAFIGCSYSFGEGVNDSVSMPSRFGVHAPRYTPYNFGCSGYGLQQFLLMMERNEIQDAVTQKSGVIIYTFISAHIRRAIGSMTVVTNWARNFPCYELVPSGIAYRGSFEEAHPMRCRLYDVLAASQFLRRFGIDVPPFLSRNDLRLMAELIGSTRDAFRRAYPDSEFVVLLHPMGGRLYSTRLIPYLEERGIRYLDYLSLFQDVDWQRGMLDHHPTPRMHDEVAKRLVEDLGLNAASADAQ